MVLEEIYSKQLWSILVSYLAKKTEPSFWMEKCQTVFDLLKKTLTESPILVFPDMNESYVMSTDAIKYTWSAVFTQSTQVFTMPKYVHLTPHYLCKWVIPEK